MSERLLLHTCCAPCTTFVAKALREEGFEVQFFFFNPNIHPFDEYARRLSALHALLLQTGEPMIAPFPYNPLSYFTAVSSQTQRCRACYSHRLEVTACWAKNQGYKHFSTTLTISPYQEVSAINRIGIEIGRAFQVNYIARDFRYGFPESKKMAEDYSLYLQNYCGCLYSDWERVKKAIWKTLSGAGCF
ncbi:MAG TPA: epoxyqueuosine reductase QueH [Atribacteraceae bacterium]|nr:epoxyqueuosine reductase QueH [Atribacteraceae bacterium]